MNLQMQSECGCGTWDCSRCYVAPVRRKKTTATAVTIYSEDEHGVFSQIESWDVLGVVDSGSRGREYQLGKKDEGLIHKVCRAPGTRIRSALTSGQRIGYHY